MGLPKKYRNSIWKFDPNKLKKKLQVAAKKYNLEQVLVDILPTLTRSQAELAGFEFIEKENIFYVINDEHYYHLIKHDGNISCLFYELDPPKIIRLKQEDILSDGEGLYIVLN